MPTFALRDQTLWLVLIDVSGSMGDPFHGSGEFKGFVEVGDYSSKLEAAKESLLKQVAGLGPDAYLTVITFSSYATVVYDGPPSNVQKLRRRLALLTPDSGTNIAARFYWPVIFPPSLGAFSARQLLWSLRMDSRTSETPLTLRGDAPNGALQLALFLLTTHQTGRPSRTLFPLAGESLSCEPRQHLPSTSLKRSSPTAVKHLLLSLSNRQQRHLQR
jgi:hypothetical protein